MARDPARVELREMSGLVHAIAGDAERLLCQHAALVREEIREGLSPAPATMAAIGAGAGLIAAGGVLGTLMMVHGLHKSTRIPLWGCYGLVGGALAAAGCGLVAAGTRRAASISLVPRETIAALREDIAWLKDQIAGPDGPS
jgi:hypothetical protein